MDMVHLQRGLPGGIPHRRTHGDSHLNLPHLTSQQTSLNSGARAAENKHTATWCCETNQ